MLLKACLNGNRTSAEHCALPVTPAQLAADVVAVRAAGAGAVHVHVKDTSGVDTFDPDHMAAALQAIRDVSPQMPVGVTTAARALSDPTERVAAIRAWRVLPDFASVNWHEDGAEVVSAALLERGVGVEAGLWHAEAVAAWATSPLRRKCLRVLIELPDGLDAARTVDSADQLLSLVRDVERDSLPILLHGEGSSCWPALRYAATAGLATRIGLEDTLQMPVGSPAPDNASLVRAAMTIIEGSVA